MSDRELPPLELSHPVTPSALGRREVVIDIDADGDQRAALAQRFGLIELPALRAGVRLRWLKGGKVLAVSGHIHARVVQSCVVTLEPVAYDIDTPFDLRLAPQDEGYDGSQEDRVADIGGVDEVEPLMGDSLDVGEVVAEELALALDPYPRKSGMAVDGGPYLAENSAIPDGSGRLDGPGTKPFEGLAVLKGNK